MQVLVATNNKGKQAEFATMLSGAADIILPENVLVLDGFDVSETGATYRENAYLKAKGFAQKANILTLADDSGLEVSALDNQPGVHSKRFFEGSDDDRNRKIVELLKHTDNRKAYFVCVIALVDPKEDEKNVSATYFEARVPGKIATKITSGEGFAYDKIFIPDGYDQTYAQLGVQMKNTISHRAEALRKTKKYLSTL